MKISLISILFILFGFSFGQSSLLSLNGFGEHLNTYDASSLGLGESRLFSTNLNGLSLSASSSFSKYNSSHLAFTVVFDQHNAKQLNKVNSNIIQFISYTFPVSQKSIFSLGMNPIFRSNLSIEEPDYQIFGANQSPIDIDNDGANDPVAYNTDYEFSGGISEFHGSFSTQIGNNFNIGLRFGKLFGSSTRNSSLKFYEIVYNQDGQITDFDIFSTQNSSSKYKYSSYNYMLDLRFSIPTIKLNHEFVFMYGKSDKMDVEVDFNNSDNSQFFSTLNGMSNYGLGFQLNLLNDFGLLMEANNYKFFKSNHLLNIFNNDYPDILSGHIGFFNLLDNYSLRYGLCYKKYSLNDQNIFDLGITFGFGFNYLNDNIFNFGIKFGEKKSEFYKLHDEKYFKLYITIISGEKWFIKKRK